MSGFFNFIFVKNHFYGDKKNKNPYICVERYSISFLKRNNRYKIVSCYKDNFIIDSWKQKKISMVWPV